MKNLLNLLLLVFLIISCGNKENTNILIGQKIMSSSEYSQSPASSLVDSNLTNNVWSNGKVGQDWIQIDFNKTYTLDTIFFDMSSVPAANCQVDVLVKSNGTEFVNIYSSNKLISSGEHYLISKKCDDVESLKIVVKNDSSWSNIVNLNILGR